MIQRQTLKPTTDESGTAENFEEPDGEIVWVLNSTRRSITVLVRTDETTIDIEPSELTVNELREKLSDNDYTQEQLEALKQKEESGKGRKTAVADIESQMEVETPR